MLPTHELTMSSDELEALHEEISRLPKAFRLPVVVCYFEGLTLDEAARKLCWPPGTVRSRLARCAISSAVRCCAVVLHFRRRL